MTSKSQPALDQPLLLLYQLLQWLISKILSPKPPPRTSPGSRPRIAVIGAGITGVTAASHICGHGFEAVIFEAGPEEQLGGIWSRVNDTSGLQIHSLMYRFHPSVSWQQGYPDRDQIVAEVRRLWLRYGLRDKTRFNVRVQSVRRSHDGHGWIVNGSENGRFDGVVVAVGTCGDVKMPALKGIDSFAGPVVHSSQLSARAVDVTNKQVIIVGGGASAVEALEFAVKHRAARVTVLSRSEKWIIPRHVVIDALLSFNLLGRETRFSWVTEWLLRRFFYGTELEELSPPSDKGFFTDTPMVNSDLMTLVREGRARWLRCDIEMLTERAVVVNHRVRGVPKGGPGHGESVEADVVIMATGFHRPSLSMLPDDCFVEPYQCPNWYLQTFPPQHPSVSAINCTFVNAVGTVGNWHIGIYTRILLMFLLDPLTRPSPVWMRRWIDMTRFLKRGAPTAAFDFFTYLELLWWFVFCVCVNPFRWKWAIFVFFGLGLRLPRAVARREERLLNSDGYRLRDQGSSF
ncbi:Flavin-binding monooxygenase-like family protein [Ophiocordyceps camponoti-floridani]|uniref:Flavin-binding monooxygenase-like family protein n=1 Tax=Ophiocordyceps camponoti-floridani TaxID=2030778 RepID=A0A8H4Q4V9_9HYPO|nr:Flavin-binding monooxygenase-like family protein [Ophiocordyceps camponoti-floridani]